MCNADLIIHRCGHSQPGKIKSKCKRYYEKKTETATTICEAIWGKHLEGHCGTLKIGALRDSNSLCSECAKLHEKRAKAEKELKKREKVLKERAEASRREFEKNKKLEENALRRQSEEREQREKLERQKRAAGKSKQVTFNQNGRLFGEANPRTSDVSTRTTEPVPVRSYTRGDSLDAPPRLADRPIHTDAYRPRVPSRATSNPDALPPMNPYCSPSPEFAPQSSRTEANISPQGGNKQATSDTTPRMPLVSRTNTGNSISRSNGRRVAPRDAGTPQDPRTRIKAAQENNGQVRANPQALPTQTVASKKPVMVSTPKNIPKPSRVRFASGTSDGPSSASRRGTVPPPQQGPNSATTSSRATTQPRQPYEQQGPPVPPKDTWRAVDPTMVPVPLSLPAKPSPPAPVRPAAGPSASAGPSTRPSGSKPNLTRTVPNRKPVAASAAKPTPPKAPAPVKATAGPSSVPARRAGTRLPGYKPDPTRTVPERKPVAASAAPPPVPPKAPERLARQASTASQRSFVPGYQPNPHFERKREERRKRNVSEEVSRPTTTSSSAAARQPSQPRTTKAPPAAYYPASPKRPAVAAAPSRALAAAASSSFSQKPEKKSPWYKRLAAAPSTETLEFISADAARIERGETITPRPRGA